MQLILKERDMSKNLFYKLFGALCVVTAVVFWILSITVPETFGDFSLAWAGVIICGGIGLAFLLQGIFQKNSTTFKKLEIWFGVALLVCAVLCLISAIAIPKSLVLPIIALVVAVGLVISILATGGKKWDEGDNQKVGYKNYHQRKQEEQEKENNDK